MGCRTVAGQQRVLITTVPFGADDPRPRAMLEAAGLAYSINPLGRRLTEDELKAQARDATILIAGTEPITSRVMDAASSLRLICRVGIGLDNVDLQTARDRGIQVTYTPDAPAPAVAELTLGLMLSLLRRIPQADRAIRDGAWRRCIGRRLDGLTVGVIGVGRVGTRVVKMVTGAFPNAAIVAHDIEPDRTFGDSHGITWATLRDLVGVSDVITVHVPLTASTRHLVGASELWHMRSDALLINTARGGVVDEAALARALREGRIGGAAVDVFECEPYAGELAGLENCILTCHMGSMSRDCRIRMEIEATEDAIRWVVGEPVRQPVPDAEYALAGPRVHR